MANQAKGKATLATKKPSKVAGKKPPNKLSKQADKASQETKLKYSVFGVVLSADAKPAVNLTVIAYDNDVANQDLLGQAVTDAKGAYAISYTEAQFKRTSQERGGADIVVSVLNAQQKVLFTSKKKNNAPAKFELNIQLPEEQFNIKGVVRDSNGKPQANIVVRAYDRDLRKEQLLGKASTAKDGSYEISYTAKDFSNAESTNAKPDLLVRIYSDANKKEPILTSETRFNVSRDEVFDFTIVVPRKPEFDQISSVVLPILKNQNADGKPLPPNELIQEDIDFIVKDTGLDQTALTAWVTSSKMQQDAIARLNNEHPKELNALKQDGWQFFYSFSRQGYADSLGVVLLQNVESWNKAWQSSVAANRVAEAKKETLDLLTNALSLMLRLEQLDPVKNADNPFARVLSAIDVSLPRKVALAALDIVQQHGLDKPDELLKLLKTHPKEQKSINTLVRGVRVNNLVSGNVDLFKNLNKWLDGDSDSASSDSIAPLAKRAAADWIDLADHTVKAGALLRIQANVEKQHPLVALQSRLDSGKDVLKGVNQTELNKIIKENGKKAESILQGKTFIKSISKTPEAFKTLQSLGQFARTGINMEMANKLIQAEVKSPTAAVREGQTAISNKIGDSYGKEAVRDVVSNFYDVVELGIKGVNAFLIENGNRHLPYGMKDDTEPYVDTYDVTGEVIDLAPTELDEVLKKLPDLPTIFGDLDECMCRPCESMLGLPAYLVDLLNFLKKFDGDALRALNEKRPDIAEMQLSCDKAEDVVLHIDIVLEMLEKAVGVDDSYLQTASAIYPWRHLPYQPERAETKVYLDKLGVSRFDLLAFHGEMTDDIAAEILNLSMGVISDWKLLTEMRSGAALRDVYGYDSNIASYLTMLCRVSVLLDRAGLDLDDLDKIIDTKSVGKITIKNRGSCKTSEMVLQIADTDREVFFDKLHRFVRLKNKLPQWTIERLDNAIVACGGLSPAQPEQLVGMLDNLARVKYLCYFYDLPIDLLLEVSKDTEKLPKLFGLSVMQWKLLNAIVGLDIQAQANFDWSALQCYCDAIKRITEAGLTIEQVAEAKLTRAELKAIFTELPASVKSNEDLEKALKKIQERLRSVVAVKADVSLETQAVEALTAIFDATTASKIVEAVNSAGAKNATNRTLETGMKNILTTKPVKSPDLDDAPDLGAWQPLLHESKADEILIVSATNKRNASERFELLLNGIAEKRRERELVLELVEFSGLPEKDVEKLLSKRLSLDDDPSLGGAAPAVDSNNAVKAFLTTITDAAKPHLHVWLDRISRLSVLSKALGLDSEFMQIADAIAAGGGYWRGALASKDPAKDSWKNHWCALLDLIWLQRPEQLSRASLDALLKKLEKRNEQPVLLATLQDLAIRFEITNDQALDIAKQAVPVDSAYAITLRNPTNLRRIFQLLLLAKKLKANSSQLAKIVNPNNNADSATTAKVLFRAKVGEQAWKKLLDEKEKVLNTVRQQSRDALVAYLVHHQELRDANDLYEKYLIDPKIEPCFETTRLLEAVTATQLFIQRILFGLVPTITADPKLKKHWVWMRNYRVWEANRKVFLFPENWLYPELRDDKSSSFNLLESALGQGELTKELAEEAFGQFLDDVAQMGQIEVLGMYEDVLNPTVASLTRNLYVVGRTPNPPYAYYWRKCIDFGSRLMEWSPWQRIELDIQGDHVMPFVLGGSFHIAWPIIKYNHQEPPKKNEWEIKLAWAMHDGKSWQKPKISRESANILDIPLMDDRWGLSFRAKLNVPENGIKIDVYALDAISNVEKTISDSTSSNGGSYIFKPEDGLSFIENLIKGGRSDTSTTEEFRNKYSELSDNLRELLEAHWMVSGSWRAIANNHNDPTIDPHGGDPAYANFKVESVDIFANPTGAIQKQILLKRVHKHLENVAFNNPAVSLPPGNSFEESLNSFLTKLNNQNNSYYSIHFKNSLASTCSSRYISCEVWLRVKIPNNTSEDLVLLDGKQGIYSCLIEGQNLSPLTPVQVHKLGEQQSPEYTLSLTINRTGTNALPLTAKSKAFQSNISIPKGSSYNQTLRFELNGLGLDVEDLRYLGVLDELESSRSLVFTHQFHLTPTNHLTINKIVQKDILPNLVISSRSWMNGYEETSSTNSNTSNPITISGRPVLKSSPLAKFWAVGSAAASPTTSQIWHFSDGGLNAYVDLKSPSNSDLLVYADSYKDATQYRVNWSSDKLLFQPNLATGSFSAKDLFNVVVDNDTKLWLIAHDKDLAKNDNFPYKSDLAFDNQLPYACYNWEVFFHAPLMIADQLSKQHKFEEAERWLRYVFDPTEHNPNETKPFFKFKVFKELDLSKQVIDDLTILAKAASGNPTSNDVEAVKKLIDRWRDLPFRPFVIARRRHIAFLWSTLFAYLDNLIAWADSLFRRDTRESINEAVMLYVLVEQILGRRPQQHDGKSKRTPYKYNELAGRWDDFANAWVSMGANVHSGAGVRASHYENYDLGGMLYFCKPFNDKILTYWNIVDDRLFNVRHCLNIEGIERQLPFTDPPIDPELLIRATAAGLDLGDVISGLYAPPPHYRYGILSARAAELANEAKSLGAAMLSAMEKRDAEHMAQLRSFNEISMLKLVKEVRTLQITEAERNLEALRGSRRSASTRFTQYQRLLGKKDIKVPAENKSVGEESMLGNIDGAASQHSSWGLIKEENEVYTGIQAANTWSTAANITKLAGSFFHFGAAVAVAVPDPSEKTAKALTATGQAVSLVGDGFSFISQAWRSHADQQGMMAGHIRRRDEWAFQSNQTLKELQQIDKQILANEIRIAITKKELDNHIEQIEQTQAMDEVMRSKFSNVQLYEWMSKQLYSLYDKTYRMALDMARRAERAAARELGVKPLNILKNDYWDSLRMGLLAGERLHHDLKRLEVAYLDQNRREFELTKHVSLRRLKPEELLKLRFGKLDEDNKRVNSCEFDIPEWLFDLDTPGHYLRRIKSVSMSIPCVVGSYTSINCKLTLLKSSIRHDKTSTDYQRKSANQTRFTDYYGASEAIVTSTASGDSGMFEIQLRDERFLPFEGSGVISTWRLELPADYPQFDYSTISDVILSVRYTARDGGVQLRNAASGDINTQLNTATSEKLQFPVLLSCKSDFPTEWAKAKTNPIEKLMIPMTKDLIPYWMDAAKLVVRKISRMTLTNSEVAAPVDSNKTVRGGVEYADLGKLAASTDDVIVILYVGK